MPPFDVQLDSSQSRLLTINLKASLSFAHVDVSRWGSLTLVFWFLFAIAAAAAEAYLMVDLVSCA